MALHQSYNDVLDGNAYDEALVENTHPRGWVNPRAASRYNLVVIGAGTAGEVAAGIAGSLGAKVALVEKNLLGGDCLITGCIPSKSLVRSARAAADVRSAAEFGIRIDGEIEVDFPAVMERMRRVRVEISGEDSIGRFRDEFGVDIFLGAGRFTGPDSIEVDGQKLRFERAIIATGSRPTVPPIEGLEQAGYQTSDSIFALQQLPRRMAVLGAGPIGCELAQAFARLGSEVTLIEAAPRILPLEESDAVTFIEQALMADGVRLLLGARLEKVEMNGAARSLYIEQGGHTIEVDEILVATGRTPNVEGLDCETADIAYDRHRGIEVDDYLRTTNSRVYAVGDVCLPEKYTHAADASSIIATQNALVFGRLRKSRLTIPRCIYTDPELAHVGASMENAAMNAVSLKSFTIDLKDVDRAVIDGEAHGMIRILAKRGSGQIAGATIVARDAGDLICEISALMNGKVGLKKLSRVIHAFPTLAEGIRATGDEFQKARLTPPLKLLTRSFFRLRRTIRR